LLRTPDPRRADQLIAERLATIRGAGVPGDTDLLLRTGFTLLGAAGRLLPDVLGELAGEFSTASLTRPVVAPVVRAALRQSMQLLGHAFIVGETIDAALARGAEDPELALCSYDVLGEGARTEADAQRYYEAYAHAIGALQRQRTRYPRALRHLGEALGTRAALHPAAELARSRAAGPAHAGARAGRRPGRHRVHHRRRRG
jgi:RHH-type proline utilization regulon transcriptional repressor/proline dehydrogenase/delta 1-pyrroline-5-carboxylate dehydrogenase